jgi:hypothetical protein
MAGGAIDNTLLIAGIVAISTTTSPLILAFFTGRQRHNETLESYARQDEVARLAKEQAAADQRRLTEVATQAKGVAVQAKEAADLLLASNAEVAAKAAEAADLLLKSNAEVAATAKEQGAKLDVIHTLVNSNMTAAMQAEYDATLRELAMMKEVRDLRLEQGQKPTPDVIGAIAATEARASELKAQLDDRQKQAALVASQAAIAETGADEAKDAANTAPPATKAPRRRRR